MPKAPDWLLQMSNNATGLVEDSPQFRQAQEAEQLKNMHSATNEALGMVQDRTTQAQQAAVAAGQRALAVGQQRLDAITPTPTPSIASHQPLFGEPTVAPVASPSPMTNELLDAATTSPSVDAPVSGNPTVPAPDEFSPDPAVVQPETTPTGTSDPHNPSGEDTQTIVQQIAAASGLSPQVVAMMAMYGKEYDNPEDLNYHPPAPAPPSPMMPNFGIGAAPPPSPLNQPQGVL